MTGVGHRAAVITFIATIASLLVLVSAQPAAAHSLNDTAVASDYHTSITAISPKISGLTVRTVRQGTRMEITNHTNESIEILGYHQERYLRITKEAVYVNERSPSAYVNEDLPTGAASKADENAIPRWQRLSNSPTVRWHDHRTHWMGNKAPAVVQQEPERYHYLSKWKIQLMAGDRPVLVTGDLAYSPPPASALWWVIVLVFALLVAVLGATRFGLPTMAMLLGLGAVTALMGSSGRAIDQGAQGWAIARTIFTTEAHCAIAAVAALASLVLVVRRQAVAAFALGLAGACLAVLCGVTNVAVFAHAWAAAPWSPNLARVGVVATLAFGIGVAIGGWLRMYRDKNGLSPLGILKRPLGKSIKIERTPGTAMRS